MTTREAYKRIREFFSRPTAQLAQFTTSCPDDPPTCVYRGNNDPESPMRCAVGCLVPDHLYNPNWEGTSAHAILDDPNRELQSLFSKVSRSFLIHAQRAHDEARSVPEFLTALDAVAADFDLQVPE